MFELSSYFANVQALPLFAVGLAMLAGGIFVFLRDMRSRVNLSFLLICLSVAVWLLSTGVGYLARTPEVAAAWFRIDNVGVIFISVNVYYFISCYLGKEDLRRRSIAVGYLLAVALALASNETGLLVTGVRRYFWGYFPKWGILSVPVLCLFFGYMLASFWSLFSQYRVTTNEAEKNQLKYFLLAFMIAYTGSVDYMAAFGVEAYPWGFVSITLFLAIIAYSMLRYRLMELRAAVIRVAIFLTVYALVMGLPFWLGFSTNEWFMALVLMGVLASVGPFAFVALHAKAENIMQARQRQYQKLLMQSSGGMVRQHTVDRLFNLIVHVVTRSVRVHYCAAFLYKKDDDLFMLKAIRGTDRLKPGYCLPANHPLISYMRRFREPFTFEELPLELRTIAGYDLSSSLFVPSFMEDRLLGFIVLGGKRDRSLYSNDDIETFMTLSNQAALAIENCLFMEEFRRAQERMYISEKLAAIGGMADGVAHQIKNRLNQFSVAAGEQKFEIEDFLRDHGDLVSRHPELRATFDYLTRLSDSLCDNVKKTSAIIQGILNFSRVDDKEMFFSEFPLSDAVMPATDLLCVKHQLASFPLLIEGDPATTVFGVKPQIIECVFNVLDNAFESIREKINYHLCDTERIMFTPGITLRAVVREDGIVLTITDNGAGIREEHQRKIFAPFFTTKSSYKSGVGIGMYVVRRMIEENHGGRIWFESQHMQGTTLFIELPRRQAVRSAATAERGE